MALELEDIMAPIDVIFKQRVANIIGVGDKGVVLYATKDTTLTGNYKIQEFKSALNLDITNATIKAQVKSIFEGSPEKVILFTFKTDLESNVDALKQLKFNWIVSDILSEQETVETYGKENDCEAIVFNITADSKYVTNATNPTVKPVGASSVPMIQYLPRLAGQLAGLPYDRSASSLRFDDLESVEMPATIAAGQYILYYDKDLECIKVANPCNSLLTLSENLTEDMKSIAIVEGQIRLETDLKYAFKEAYKGKYKNTYDNQCLFLSAVNGYIRKLEDLRILDPSYNNVAKIDLDALRSAWLESGKDEAETWTDNELKVKTFKNKLFVLLDVKFLDAMEGIQINVEMF